MNHQSFGGPPRHASGGCSGCVTAHVERPARAPLRAGIPSAIELRRGPLFAALDDETIETLRGSATVRVVTRGESLFCEGDEATRFYFVRTGQLKLFVASASGREKVLEVATPGATVAEAAIFLGRPAYPASAEAITRSTVVGFDGVELMRLLAQSPASCMRLIGHLSMRLRQRVREIDALSCQDVRTRVAAHLLGLVRAEPAGRLIIEFGVPRYVIAARLSLRPETLSRVMSQLGAARVVEVEGDTIRVVDLDVLARLAGEQAGV